MKLWEAQWCVCGIRLAVPTAVAGALVVAAADVRRLAGQQRKTHSLLAHWLLSVDIAIVPMFSVYLLK
jgi:hypothetical protein